MREVKRAQLAKEERERNAGNQKGKTRIDDVEMGDPGAEKARLLENEGAIHRTSHEREPDVTNATSPRTSQGDETVTRSFMSPTSDNPYAVAESPISEKARGKMRERRSLSVETINSLDRAPASIGRNGFIPTQEWVRHFFVNYLCLH